MPAISATMSKYALASMRSATAPLTRFVAVLASSVVNSTRLGYTPSSDGNQMASDPNGDGPGCEKTP